MCDKQCAACACSNPLSNGVEFKRIEDFPPEKVAEWNKLNGYIKPGDLSTTAPQSVQGNKRRRHVQKGGEQR